MSNNGFFIGPGVELGLRVMIAPGAVVLGPCTIEDDAWVGPSVVIGGPPEITSARQNISWEGEIEHSGVHISRGCVIREGAVITQGSSRATIIGENSWVLNRAYVAHDVKIGANVIISSGAAIGGHCEVGDWANIGMNAAVHQRRKIGAGAMVGMSTPVTKDIPPFLKAFGSPVRIRGLNEFALERLGVEPQAVFRIQTLISEGSDALDALSRNVKNEQVERELHNWKAMEG